MAARMSSEYWCHQCNHTTVPIIGDDLCCPRCNGGFVEEIEAPPQRHVEPSPVEFMGPRLMALMRGAGLRGQREMPLDEISENQPQRVLVLEQSPLMMQMMQAFSSALVGMHAAGEEQEENSGVVVVDPMGVPMFILQGANGVGAQHVPGAVGDYFMGPGMEMLLQRLAENDPNRYGTPPAAKEAVEAIPAVKITEEHLKSECSSECAVCKEDFTAGEETRQLPCKHLYHAHCIFPWLKMHSSCPVCRFQMPTDDDEESGKGQSEESTSEGVRRGDGDNGSGAEGNDSNSNGNNRWFRISVPFSMIGSLVSSALGNGNRNRDNSSNHGGGNGANPSDHS